MQHVISRWFFQGALLASWVSFVAARATGGNLELAVAIPAAVTLVLAMVLERVAPFRPEWNRDDSDTSTDWFSMAALLGVIDPVLKWTGPMLVIVMYGRLDAANKLFPAGLPFVLQVTVAALIAEFGYYWAHRLHHSRPALWWLHALHHGSGRLYTVNNFRLHPLNYAVNYACGMLPLLAIGTPADVLYGYLALTYPVLMLQHANLPLRSGWLNYVFSTNEVHRWHHSAASGEGDTNFGRSLVFWDIIFGTFRYQPQGANLPHAIGLYAGSAYPARAPYWRQVLSMFLPGCCKAAG